MIYIQIFRDSDSFKNINVKNQRLSLVTAFRIYLFRRHIAFSWSYFDITISSYCGIYAISIHLWLSISLDVILFYGSTYRHLCMKSRHSLEMSFRLVIRRGSSEMSTSIFLPVSIIRRVMPDAQISPPWVFVFLLEYSILLKASGGIKFLVPLLDAISIS